MRILASVTGLACLLSATAWAQEDAPEDGDAREGGEGAPVLELPPPVLEGEEPVAPAEPLPSAPEEDPPPAILHRIGPDNPPDWQAEMDREPVRDDIAFETPGDLRTRNADMTNSPGARMQGTNPEEPMPPFVLAAGVGWGRLLASAAVDFVRVEERFEAMIPEFPSLRLGAGATQMFSDQGFLGGGGVRLGLGVPICSTGDLVCDGVAFIQPGVLAGFFGVRFDLDAILSLRLNIGRVFQMAVEGGYSLLFDGNSLLHLSGSAGGVF